MTADEAEQLVIDNLEVEAFSMAVIPNTTYETTKCFVVSCQSKEYVETGNEAHFLIGHGPVFLIKKRGEYIQPVQREMQRVISLLMKSMVTRIKA